MKINVQKDKNSKIYQVEIPSTVDLTHLSKGELFPVYITDEKGQTKKIESCLLADGRSFLLDNKVVRFNHSQVSKKNEIYRFGIQNDGIVTQNHVIASILRPVKPRISSSNLSGGEMKSPMTGKVISISVKNNSKVREGDTIVIIEAMKMENRIVAECDGIVSNIKVNPGMSVSAGDLLLSIIPEIQG
jgi:biotin carboxyl carrier protein